MAKQKNTYNLDQQSKNDVRLLGRMLQLVKPYKFPFGISSLLALFLAVLAPLKPYIITKTINDNILSSTGIGLKEMVMLFFGVLVLEGILRYTFLYLTRFVGQSVIKDLRTKIYNHISGLQLNFFNQTPIGTLTTRTINDTEAVNKTFSNGLITIVSDVLTIVVIISIMFATDWRLTLLTLVPFPLILTATYIFKEKVKKAFMRERKTLQNLNSFMQERISGMKIVQLFAIEDQELKKFNKINNANKQANVDTVMYYAVYFPVIDILTSVSLALLVWFAGNKILGGVQPEYIGLITGFYMWSQQLFRPLRMLADKFNELQRGLIASQRIFNLLDTDAVFEEQGTFLPVQLNGHVAFKNVQFGYNPHEPVLKGISFELHPGQTLALVGSTGSGKSTTINLINRFYDIQEGQVLIDGRDIKDYQLDGLRSKIATVQQDVFLFSGSILENIQLNDESITKADIEDAAKQVGVHEFILSLPGGYDYKVMERGSTLSSGQRQLISFIRAMVANPDLLILDEATAAIDTETELLIQAATEKLMKGRTSIVIAHRLSTIQHADTIVVLDQGEIIESGSHKALMELDGAYKRLHDMQFKKQEVVA
ncbi:MAG: ABC transporter ATP-binding protein/permease [Saprospiraceae bacterium]|nr:ABC transporter ATP-binding protein/permease [Saprospiraceae bacterium]